MRIRNRKLLDSARELPRCEWCFAPNRGDVVYHHAVLAKGYGTGGSDIMVNLIGLCWRCHDETHRGHEPTKAQLIAKIAAREGQSVEWIEAENYRIRSLPK